MVVECLTASKVAGAALVEAECLSTAWSEAQLRSLPPEAVYLTACEGETVCGIASLYCVCGEAELQNIAVLPAYRRSGVAQALMDALVVQARAHSCEAMFLEVAEHNAPARALYEKNGFVPVGRRKGFYRGEDAIVMRKSIDENG